MELTAIRLRVRSKKKAERSAKRQKITFGEFVRRAIDAAIVTSVNREESR
jgi:hypothetical protein